MKTDLKSRIENMTEREAKDTLLKFSLYVGRNIKCLHNSEDECQFYHLNICHNNSDEDCALLWLEDALQKNNEG